VSARVPLELVPVGARVRVYCTHPAGHRYDGTEGVVFRQYEADARILGNTLLDDEWHAYAHGRWLAEVIDAPAPQQPRGEEASDNARLLELAERLIAVGPKASHVSASECHEISNGVFELVAEIGRLKEETAAAGRRAGEIFTIAEERLAEVARLRDQVTLHGRQAEGCLALAESRQAEITRLRADLAYHDRQAAQRDAAGRVAGHAEQCGCHGCVTGPLRVEIERLRAALERYGAHLLSCRRVTNVFAPRPCDCGLADALKEAKQP
jgi:uncharacterized small protein (DUF1192 family)